MPTTNITINAQDLMRQVTMVVKLTHIRQLTWRLWLGAQLAQLAAWVVGCGIEIIEDETEDASPGRQGARVLKQRTRLGSIYTVPLECECGWAGKVINAEPDCDGDGGLGCPSCHKVLDSRFPVEKGGMMAKPQPGPVGQWLDELEENQMPVHCQLCDEPIDYPFGENWIAWCRKCACDRWEEVMIAIMRLRDDG